MKNIIFRQLLFLAITIAFLPIYCGKSPRDTKNSGDSPSATISDPGSLTVLPVTEGMRGEAQVKIEANAFPEGTLVTAKGVSSPDSFLNNQENVPLASGALEVSATYKDEALESTTAPMTISIPTDNSLSLFLLQDTDAKLCVFHLNHSNQSSVWRRSDFVSINKEQNLGTFQATSLGIFQLSECGDTTLSGFTEAKEQGIIGSGSTLSAESFACGEGSKEVFDEYKAVESCSTHLNIFESCLCSTVEALTQQECEERIASEFKAKVCVDSSFEVNETINNQWSLDCTDAATSIQEAYSDICTF